MRFSRLAVEANGRTIKIAFHPRFTVITGVGSASRESLVQELIGGLGSNRSGTHLEVHTDGGRALTMFRPPEAAHRAIDMATGEEVSDEFRSDTGVIDMLGHYGLDVASARRWMRIGPNDLVATTRSQQLITRIARINQSELWSAAQRVQVARLNVAETTDQGPVEDEGLAERIDESYQAVDDASKQSEKTRKLALVVGTVSTVAAGLAAPVSLTATAVLLLIAASATAVAFVFRARVRRYDHQLHEALGEAGSDSYLGFQLNRIDHYVSNEHERRHRAAARVDVSEALVLWKRVAGDVTVDWVMEHRLAIEAAARLQGVRQDAAAVDGSTSLVPAPSNAVEEAPEFIDSMLDRLNRARHLGSGDESFPLLLDEPFGTLDPSVRPALLEVLVRQAGSPQVILLTNEADIVAWARLEALTGAISLVGPGEGVTPAPDASMPAQTKPSSISDLPRST